MKSNSLQDVLNMLALSHVVFDLMMKQGTCCVNIVLDSRNFSVCYIGTHWNYTEGMKKNQIDIFDCRGRGWYVLLLMFNAKMASVFVGWRFTRFESHF